ncbi:MAG: hypothetical protein WC294_00290 [Methanoregula sp.]|jgi:hypothetical protein
MNGDKHKLFCSCDGDKHDQESFNCADPSMVIQALKDAKRNMDYSNWHNDKFDRAITVIELFCDEKRIPLRFIDGELEEEQKRIRERQVNETTNRRPEKAAHPVSWGVLAHCNIFI